MNKSKDNQSLSVRQLCRLLKHFNLREGDVLALKQGKQTASLEVVEEISKALGKMGYANVLIIVVEDFDDMTILNETAMNKHGWYHLKSLAKMMKLPSEIKQ